MANDKQKIGFIGLGLMGSAMVQRLLDLGYELNVIANRSRTNIEAAVARGATEFGTARELAAASDIIMLCMDNSKSVESRMFGSDGVIAGLKGSELIIDFGTSLPGSTLKIFAEVQKTGASYMDAPLGRTPSHGREGKLNIMAAGRDMDFARAKPVFEDLGESVFHIGALGAGHTLKLINNFYAMTSAVAMSESFAMADRAGLSRQMLYDVMSAGPNKSAMMDFIKAEAIDKKTLLAFSIENGAKDVGYYLKMVEDFGRDSAVGSGTAKSLTQAIDAGCGPDMVSQMVNYFAGKNEAPDE